MDWNAIQSVADAASAVAVVGSIFYLAFQIRQNTISNRITARQNSTDHFTTFTYVMMQDPELRNIWNRGRRSMGTLSESEVEVFHYINQTLTFYYSSQHFQYRQGALDEIEWAQSLGLIQSSWLESPGTREWWRSLDKRRVTEPFRQLIEAEIARIEAAL